MIKLDKDKIIPSAIEGDQPQQADAPLPQEEVAGSLKGIQDEPTGEAE